MTISSVRSRTATPLTELSVARLTHEVAIDGKLLPSGTAGTIVHVYADAAAYEVEFKSPFHAVVTLEAADLIA